MMSETDVSRRGQPVAAPPAVFAAGFWCSIDTSPTHATIAYVNDNRREIVGIDAIRRWVEKELVGDLVTMTVREIVDHHGEIIVRAAYDGNFDRTNLPAEVILSNYFRVSGGKIVSVTIIFNEAPGMALPSGGGCVSRAARC